MAFAVLLATAALSTPVAGCEQAAVPGPGSETRPGDIRFGAFSLSGGYVADEPRRSFKANADGEYPAWKMGAVLRRGSRARLRVAKRDRGNASLLYARPHPEGDRYFAISEGRTRERFRACDDRDWSPWPGYVVVRGARCVRLQGRVGRGKWITRRVAFGRRTCR